MLDAREPVIDLWVVLEQDRLAERDLLALARCVGPLDLLVPGAESAYPEFCAKWKRWGAQRRASARAVADAYAEVERLVLDKERWVPLWEGIRDSCDARVRKKYVGMRWGQVKGLRAVLHSMLVVRERGA